MAQVPYSPVPTVSPQDRPIPYREENVPIAAFGGATAQALQHLGEVDQRAGTELFDRAVAIQQMDQQARASEAVSGFVTQLGSATEEYRQLTGKASADGYQPYIDGVNALREHIRESLTSPFARRAYDMESRQMMSRAVWSASSHAADQQTAYLKQVSKSAKDANINYMLANPEDDATYKKALEAAPDIIRGDDTYHGADEDTIKQAITSYQSNLTRARIQGLAKTKPLLAKTLLDKAAADGNIQGQDLLDMTNYVQGQMHSQGSQQLGTQIVSGDHNRLGDRTDIDMGMAKRVVGGGESGNRYEVPHRPVPSGPHKGAVAQGYYGVMDFHFGQKSGDDDWPVEAGLPHMTPQQFVQDHDAQDRVFEFKFGQFLKNHNGNFNEALRDWFGHGRSDGFTSWEDYKTRANARLGREMSGSTLGDIARQRAGEQMPGDEAFAELTRQKVETQHYRDIRDQREDEIRLKMPIDDAMAPSPDGKVVTSPEELFVKSPDLQDKWNQLNPHDRKTYLHEMEVNARQGGYGYTPEGDAEFQRIIGVMKDPDRSPEESDAAVGINIMSLKIPWVQKEQLLRAREQLMKTREAEPDMKKAMQVLMLRGVLDDAGLERGKLDSDERKEYNRFEGVFYQTLHDTQHDQKKPLADDEIEDMGRRLTQQVKTKQPAWFGLSTKEVDTPAYKVEPDADQRDIIIGVWKKAHAGLVPSESDIRNTFIAAQYTSMYGKKKAKPSE